MDEQLHLIKDLYYTLKSINQVNTSAVLEIHKHQLEIGKSLYSIREIVKKYHPEALLRSENAEAEAPSLGKTGFTRRSHGHPPGP